MAEFMNLFTNEVQRQSKEVVHFYSCIRSDGFYTCYDRYDSLTSAWALVTFFAMYSFIFSIIGNNCSKVDQLWSITPILYAWHFYWHDQRHSAGAEHPRLLAICALVTLWGARLTFNFWRKGGYGNLIHHEEDYRWPILRKMMHPALFLLFNFSFIAWYQNILLFLIAAPAYEVMRGDRVMTPVDWILVGLFLVFFLIETIADEQHFVFQTLKYSLTPAQRATHANLDVRRGFFTTGLFAISRHPNYFGEQSMWVVIYAFSVARVLPTLPAVFATISSQKPDLNNLAALLVLHFTPFVNWTISGCLQLILLFQGSMTFGESITVSKYPDYRFYQRVTNRCIPGLPHAPLPAPTAKGK